MLEFRDAANYIVFPVFGADAKYPEELTLDAAGEGQSNPRDQLIAHVPALRRYADIMCMPGARDVDALVATCILRALDYFGARRLAPKDLRGSLFATLHALIANGAETDESGAATAAIAIPRRRLAELTGLRRVVASLPLAQKAAFALVCIEDFTYVEAGAILRLPAAAVANAVLCAREAASSILAYRNTAA